MPIERLAGDLREKGFYTINLPLEIGCMGVLNARNSVVLETLCNALKIPARQKLRGALGRIALLGSYRIWLARHSPEWSGGSLIKVTWIQTMKLTDSQYSMYTVIDFDLVDQLYYCCSDNPFCSGNSCPGAKNPTGNIQLFGLVWRVLGELALLGLILPLEVYSVVSCLFLYCFEKIKKYFPKKGRTLLEWTDELLS